MDKRSLGYVRTELNDNIATITFSHPAHNSLPGHLLKELSQSIRSLEDKDDIHVLILKSDGNRTFCAGASFDELTAVSNPEEGKKFFMGFAQVIEACRNSSKVIIGRIQGKAVGGGVGLISAVDYAIANEYASIRLSELKLGLGPFVIGPAVKRKIGNRLYAQLALTPSDWKSAQWAQTNHLYDEIFTTTEEVDERVASLSTELASYNPEALKSLKQVIWRGTEEWPSLLLHQAEISGKLILSEYTKNAIAAFKVKR